MQRKTETINGREFAVTSLPAVTSLRLQSELARRHGGEIMALSLAGELKDAEKIGSAFRDLFHTLDPDMIEKLRHTFAQVSTIDNRPIADKGSFEAAFTGRPEDMLAWLKFCLNAEFGELFRAVLGQVAATGDQDTPST